MGASTSLEIANMALAHCGESKAITSLTADAAKTDRLWRSADLVHELGHGFHFFGSLRIIRFLASAKLMIFPYIGADNRFAMPFR